LIIFADVTNSQADQDQLEPAMVQLKEQLNVTPENVAADKGYYNIAQIQNIETNSLTTCFVPHEDSAKKQSDRASGIAFTFILRRMNISVPKERHWCFNLAT
jgi:hypothetical protein